MNKNKNYIALFLKRVRKQARMTAREASKRLLERGIELSGVTINGYENNRSMPDAEKFLALCAVYGVENSIPLMNEVIDGRNTKTFGESVEECEINELDNQARNDFKYNERPLSPEEGRLVEIYRRLRLKSKKLVDDVVQRLYQLEEYQNESKATPFISYPVYGFPASVGTESFLDGDSYELVDFPVDAVP